MKRWLNELIHPTSIQHQMRWLVAAFAVLSAVILLSALSLLAIYHSSYADLLSHAAAASDLDLSVQPDAGGALSAGEAGAAQLNALQEQVSRQIIRGVILLTLLTALLIAAFTRHTLHLSRSITKPIVDLCARVEDIGGGDLTVREPVQSAQYEIRTLSEGFEQMVGRVNRLLQETTQKQDSLRRTELALIQAQVNPHFLYNTMDTIIWLIEAKKTQEAVEMVSDLSSFFRHSLSKGQDVITLREDLYHVCSYLQIQQVRYKDIMQYTVNVAQDLQEAMIPKLTLQPLVENALYHGIKLKRGIGHIYVTGWADGEDILLQVTDDGVGMSQKRLDQLTQAMDQGDRVGFGLSTVHERIRLLFGPPYGLSISSREGVGTSVHIRIPRRFQAEKSE